MNKKLKAFFCRNHFKKDLNYLATPIKDFGYLVPHYIFLYLESVDYHLVQSNRKTSLRASSQVLLLLFTLRFGAAHFKYVLLVTAVIYLLFSYLFTQSGDSQIHKDILTGSHNCFS